MKTTQEEKLFPKHGGYRKLKSYQLAQLVYDVTVRFCDCYIEKRSRTHDQMVQAARSGVQNIAEGSQASGTSKKSELRLTNVARSSLEELRLDYEDYLRQRKQPLLPPDHPALSRFKAKRCATLEQLRTWVAEELPKHQVNGLSSAVLVANASLSLLNLCCFLLDRQLDAQARAFERDGGFSERLYQRRRARTQGRTRTNKDRH